LVADAKAVKGYVVDGGWIKTWYEHMLEMERRRLSLAGHGPNEINDLMKSVESLYSAYLLEQKSPQEILLGRPDLKSLWQGDPDQQYGRPTSYYQQLQELDLLAAWSAVRVPVLAIHGEYDWIMSDGDLRLLAETVNRNSSGVAELWNSPTQDTRSSTMTPCGALLRERQGRLTMRSPKRWAVGSSAIADCVCHGCGKRAPLCATHRY
jgi:pimeloyl-ACP methyl ester carboxylesterase